MMQVDPSFWKGKKVFLTGHTGFKGSWLCLWLHRLGAKVTGYALAPPSEPSLFEIARIGELITSIHGDVRDQEKFRQALQQARPEIVIHMAAQPLVRDSYKLAVETYSINVMGIVHLLESVRDCPSVRAVVNITTDKCYENREWVWGYRENDPVGGRDPYSNSKACSELVTAAYRSSFFNPDSYGEHGVAVASARAGNVIGGGDWAEDRLVPDIVRAAEEGHTVRLRMPNAVRPWQHVLDPLAGYMMLAERLCLDGSSCAEGWNFGPADADARSVEWIVREMASQWDRVRWEKDQGNHPHEAHYLKLDCSKARARLGWSPQLPLSEALAWTVRWYKAYTNSPSMRTLTVEQIENYMELMQT